MAQQEVTKAAPETRASSTRHQSTLHTSLSSFVSSTSTQIIAHAPSLEDSIKFSGGAVAALVAMRYAGSLRSACIVGFLSGLFAHSFYVDVIRKKRRERDEKRERQGEKDRELYPEEEEEEEDTE
ncbi:unnamed protein product [Peronospora belbahrii]|uniref:Cytochrome c oxidase assembly protein COX20, mitochondrial n=1 Tax=Peronospora belbahrii TaxID=622444 RepID=A0AAU9KNR9_9STRA|nr:unnamed protein product [Peronospora belbahrii]CAH0517607.1 unnamed protein product [Peronospora belbahrii]